MKKKLISVVFLFVLFSFGAYSPAFADLTAQPIPHLSSTERGSFQTNLFTGSAGYSYQLPLPKGTNDLTPAVNLSYDNSSANFLPAYAGMGWDLNRDYIEDDPSSTPGSSNYYRYKLHLQGASYDVVYISADSNYHTEVESHLLVKKFGSGGSNSDGTYWQVTSKDGTVYRFGYLSNSELVCSDNSQVRAWNLDQITDTHGNKIYYNYSTSNNISYLSSIKYNNDQTREVDFTYASSPYARKVTQWNCGTQEASQLSNIQVKANSSLVHQFDLSYTTASAGGQLLTSITEKGSDGSSTLPSTRFDYYPEVKSWNTQFDTWINNAAVDVRLNMTNQRLIDVNGDGLPDIVKTDANGGNDTWKVLFNTGNGWSTSWTNWIYNQSVDANLSQTYTTLIDVTGDGLPDIVKADNTGTVWKVFRNTGSSWNPTEEVWANDSNFPNLRDPLVGMMDVNGDGLVDLIRTSANLNSHSTWEIFFNTGSGWNNSTNTKWWSNVNVDARLDESNVRLVDVNGDGLPDIVKTTNSGTNATWLVYKNTGSTWNTTPETWVNNANIDAYFGNPNVVLADVNGDGLPDIVKSTDLGSADKWEVLLNLGNSWSTTYETWIDPSYNLDVDAHSDSTTIADVNGDGLADLVSTTYSGSNDTWKVITNKGYAPHLLSTITNSQGGIIRSK